MRTNKNKKIAIFGGSGFVGKSLLKFLISEKTEIVIFTRKKKYKQTLDKFYPKNNIQCIEWNINDLNDV